MSADSTRPDDVRRFVPRTNDVTLSDIVVEGCLFVVSGALESVIGVEKCNSELLMGTIRLNRVEFRENHFFGGAVAIQANASSCSRLEIEDFDFHTNTCNGICGLLLTRENRLQNIAIEQNRPMLSFNGVCGLLAEENRIQNLSVEHYRSVLSLSSRSLIIWAPPQSSTSGDKIRALENSCTIFHVEGGSFHLSNSNFTKNSVTGEGDESISTCIELKDVSASIRDCSFEENESHCGVAVHAQKTELSVTRLSCVRNEAGSRGGCLYLDVFSSLNLSDSVLEGNRARSGGALFFRKASAVIVNSSVLSNRADKRGGGIHSIDSHIIANELTADGNRAERGGGGSISIASKSNLTVHDSVFKNSFGHKGGAVRVSENSVGRFVNVTFVNNAAYYAGGSVSVSNATLIIHNSRFRDGGYEDRISYSNGFLFAVSNSSVFVKHVTMTNGTEGIGGAIMLQRSIFEANDLNVSDCTADSYGGGGAINVKKSIFKAKQLEVSNCTATTSSGGAIYLKKSIFKAKQLKVSNCTALVNGGAVCADDSEFLCTDCLFASNKVDDSYGGGGGALSITRSRRRRSAIQLQKSRIVNNSARIGGESTKSCTDGAISLDCFVGGLSLDDSNDCSKNGCTAIAIIDTQFKGNNASLVGGAIFANRLESIGFQCNSSSENDNLTFLDEKDWNSLRRVTPDEALCPSWRNNSAFRYGQVVGTYAKMAKMTVEYEGKETEVLSGEGYEVPDYVGGSQLPTMAVEFLDELKQGPATVNTHHGISAVLSTSEGFQVGNVSLPARGRKASFPGMIGFGLPGIYNMSIRFIQDNSRDVTDIDPLIITVHVRNCTIGEVPVGKTKICNNCSTSAYNFDPEAEECQPCPKNGNCTTRVVIPNAGYWHATPCSVNISRCLTSYACKFDNRLERLTNLTRNMKNCTVNTTTIEEYQQKQCVEARDQSHIRSAEPCSLIQGHTGPLCGACNTSYGSSLSSGCEKCPTTFGNVMIICVAAVILLVLSGFTIRGTLSTANSRRAMLSGMGRIPRGIQLEDLPFPCEAEASEMQASQEESPKVQSTNQMQECVSITEVTLGQWKAVETFKV